MTPTARGKTVEEACRLIEGDEVLLIFYSLGTPTNSSMQRYMNAKNVRQLFVASGAVKWNDPKKFPRTMGWAPSYQAEGFIYAQYLLRNHPEGKIATLCQNDDFGKDYLKGLTDGLAGKIPVVARVPMKRRTRVPISQVASLQASGPTSSSTSPPRLCLDSRLCGRRRPSALRVRRPHHRSKKGTAAFER